MDRQVVADAVAELVLTQVLLEHAQDGRTLLVGEDVEHALGIARRHDLELDRSRADEEFARSMPEFFS